MIKIKIELHQLKNIQQCKFKAYIAQFNFKTLNNKSLMIKKVYKDILQGYSFINLSKNDLKNIIEDKLEEKFFLTKQEKELEVITILNNLLRYIEYEKNLNRRILHKKICGSVKIKNIEIELNADMAFENANSIEIVKYKVGATTLSYKARTEKNLPENNIELFLLKKLGEKIYSKFKKPIVASFYHFKGKNEDKDVYKQFLEDRLPLETRINELKEQKEFVTNKKELKALDKQIKQIGDVLFFNNSEGNNIITFDYDKDLSDEILELTNTKLDFNSERCQSYDCDICSYSTLCNYKYIDIENESKLEIVKELKKSSGEMKLTDAQKQVVDIEEGNYRINAVPGSGKSSSVVMRTIELFKKGYKPKDILMITFTNKGAEELKEKISYWLNFYKIKGIKVNDLNIFTFNSFGENIISKEWSKLEFTQEPQLATTIDIMDTIKELLIEYNKIKWLNYKNPLMNYPNAKGAFIQLIIYFNSIKSFNYTVDKLAEKLLKKENGSIEDLKIKANLIFELYNKFNFILKEKNLLQYEDQILYLIQLLEKYPKLINQYGFKHIIVDEYQDTDFSQVNLLHLLKQYKRYKSLMVVGDNSQAIYGFRNTTPENILNFDKEFENVKDIFLLDNFRSTPEICNVINQLDELNNNRIDKKVISKREPGKIPELLEFETNEDEYKYVVDLIQEKIEKEVPMNEICYIARTKKELLELQKLLNEKNIPNIVEASELYLDNTNVQCIVNLANFFKNAEQDYYLMEYLSIINKDFNDLTTEEINKQVAAIKESLISSFKLKIEDNENDILLKDEDQVENKLSEEDKINNFYSLLNPIAEIDQVANSFIEKLKSKTFHTFNEFLSYLYKIVLYNDNAAIEKDDKKYNAVTLVTAHSSKGKEWDIVINSINNYKYENISNDLELLEEERRLLFVSLSRAKNELYITYNTNENKIKNRGKYCLFADELEGVKKIEL